MSEATKEPEPMVQVRIQARQTVRYDQIKTMTVAEWQRLKSTDEDSIGDEVAGLWLDLSDVSDIDDIDGSDVEIFVCDDNGKPVKPKDEYEG